MSVTPNFLRFAQNVDYSIYCSLVTVKRLSITVIQIIEASIEFECFACINFTY